MASLVELIACYSSHLDDDAAVLLVAAAIFTVHAAAGVRDRHYIRTLALTGVPRSAWRAVYDSRDDDSFILTTGIIPLLARLFLVAFLHAAGCIAGFPCAVFYLIAEVFTPLYIARASARLHAGTTVGRPRSLTPHDALGLTLMWLRSRMSNIFLQLIFGISASTLSRAWDSGIISLRRALDTLPDAAIRWPDAAAMLSYAMLGAEYDEELPPGLIGFLDGSVLPMQEPADPFHQNAYWSGYHKIVCVNNIFVFGPDGCVIWCRTNCPGHMHDSTCCEDTLYPTLAQLPAPYYVLADKAFRGLGALEKRIRKSGGRTLEGLAITRARQAAEWGMRLLKSTWPRLNVPLTVRTHQRQIIISTCVRLSNLRSRLVGINQIRTVFEPAHAPVLPADDLLRQHAI